MDERCKDRLEYLKNIKRDVGAILSDIKVDEVKQNLIGLTDDELMIRIGILFGKFAMYVLSTKKVMAAYGVAVAYFLAEEEAKARNLYP